MSLGEALAWTLSVGGSLCLLRAAFLLLFRIPASAVVTHSGYETAMREREAAVFLTERAPVPLTVLDYIRFETAGGEEVRVEVRRWAGPHDRLLTIWYAPHDPRRAAVIGPGTWLCLWLAAIGLMAALAWG